VVLFCCVCLFSPSNSMYEITSSSDCFSFFLYFLCCAFPPPRTLMMQTISLLFPFFVRSFFLSFFLTHSLHSLFVCYYLPNNNFEILHKSKVKQKAVTFSTFNFYKFLKRTIKTNKRGRKKEQREQKRKTTNENNNN
jgi:sensor histidine kinase YesM